MTMPDRVRMGSTMPAGTSPRQRHGRPSDAHRQPVVPRSDCLRAFRALTDGQRSRMRLPSLPSMRAGTVRNPLEHLALFLDAGRRAGLTREWAERVLVFCEALAEAAWSGQVAAEPYLFRRDQEEENQGNLVAMHYLMHRTPDRDERRRLAAQLFEEAAAKRALARGLLQAAEAP